METPSADTPMLTALEARILGCLVEKAATTPDVYPLTPNALVLACNQKTAREPVMEVDPGEVGSALRRLEVRGWARGEHGARSERWSHRVERMLDVTHPQACLLALLMLRGPQTLHELVSRSERLHRFADADDALHALERLAGRETPLVRRLPRAPGQREERYAHLLCGEPEDLPVRAGASGRDHARDAGDDRDALLARIEALEARVAALEAAHPQG